jgi:hypothetical protein
MVLYCSSGGGSGDCSSGGGSVMDGNTHALNDQQTGAPRKKKKGEAAMLTASPFIFFLDTAVW